MRAVLTTFGSTGDVQPLLALAVELQRGGHHPILALSPNFERRVTSLGVDFVATGPSLPQSAIGKVIALQMKNRTPSEQVRIFLEAVLVALPEIYRTLLSICDHADVLIASPYQIAGRMVHDTMSIPYVSLHLSQFGDLGGDETRNVSACLINPYRVREGVAPLDDPLGADARSSELALYAVSPHLLQRPAEWPDHCKVVGFFFLDESTWTPDSNLAAFCASAEKPIVISFGSVVHPAPRAVTRVLLDALGQVGKRAVLQQGWSGLAEGVTTANLLVTGFVPHTWLFAKAALIVHHGGAGTTAAALRAGVPAVVIPHTLDQPIWAELARAKGCVRNVIPIAQLTAPRLAASIKATLMSTATYEAAGTFGAEIRRESGTETARRWIESVVASRQAKPTAVGDTVSFVKDSAPIEAGHECRK